MKNYFLSLAVLIFSFSYNYAQNCTFDRQILTIDSVLCQGESTTLDFTIFNDTLLNTPIINNNGQDGNMFDITATTDIIINYFEGNIANTPNPTTSYFVYYKTGSHVGFENNSSAWTLLEGPVTFAPNTPNTLTEIPVDINILIPAGETYAFYLTNSSAAVNNNRYSNGTATGAVLASNSDLTIYEGAGGAYPFGTFFNARPWEGIVHYSSPIEVDYLWNTGATTPSITVQPNTTTDYSCVATVLATSNCIVQDTVHVEVNPLPTLQLDDLIVCETSYVIDAGNPGSTYLWCSGETTQTITATQSGIYCVTVTSVAGCSKSDTLNLEFNSQFQADITANGTPVAPLSTYSLCNGLNLQLGINSVPGVTYQWNGPNSFSSTSQNPLITNIQPVNSGNYTLTITTATNCTITVTFIIDVVETPVIDPVNNITVCNGDQISEIQIGGSVPDVDYLWTNDNTTIGLAADGIGNIATFTAVNTGTTAEVATIEINASTVGSVLLKDTFYFTGQVDTFTVPEGTDSVHIQAWGAQGGANWVNNVNFGGYAEGDLPVNPGEDLYIYVGQQPTSSVGGWNGGGAGDGFGMGGGGATDVRQGGTSLMDRVIVAAGAGGAGYWSNFHVVGGVGGGLIGGDGYREPADPGGLGASQTGPGASGTCVAFNVTQMAGSFGQGGTPLGFNCGCEGYGGGAGWYGGAGSGNCRGGGGGSSYIDGVVNGATTAGVNVGNGYLILTYYIGSSACEAASETFTITVKPTPSVSALPASQVICSGTAISSIVLSGPVGGSSFNWTRDNTASVTGIPTSGSGNISGTLTNTTGAPVIVTFTITPTANGCTGIPVTVTITVNPGVSALATPASQTICSGAAITTIVMSGSGTTYNWSRNNTATVTGIAATGSGNISGSLVNTTSSPVTVTFTIIPEANGCSGSPVTSTVTVNPVPSASALPAQQTICGGSITTIVLSGPVSGTTFNWSRDNTATVTGIAASGSGNISGTMTNTTLSPVIVTFTITPVASGCTGIPVTATVTVNPGVNAIATPASQTICSGATITTIVMSGSGTTYNWSRDNTATVTGIAGTGSGNISGSLVNTTSSPVIVTFTITPEANGCSGSPVTSTVTVNPVPTASALPAQQTICSGGSITTIVLSGTVSGTSFNWSRDNTATVTGIAASGTGNISGALTNTTLAPVLVTFTITPVANGCTGTPVTATVTVNPTIILTVAPATQTICSGQSVTPIVPGGGGPGANYTWTRNNIVSVTGMAASGSGNVTGILINNTNAPVTVTFTFNATSNQNCNSVPVTATVIVDPLPDASMSITPNPACVGSSVNFSATGGNTYSWSGPQGWTSTQQNPTLLLVNHLQEGTYWVTITNSEGCIRILSSVLTVFYPPVATAEYNLSTACIGSDLELFGNGAGSYLWTGPNGWTSEKQNPVIEDVTAINSGLYTLVVTSPNGCTATSTLQITISAPPALSANPVLTQTCEGSTIQLFATGTGNFSWSGPATWISNDQNPVISNIPLYLSGKYTVTLTSETGCASEKSVEVEVYPQIVVNATATPDTVCEGQSVQLFAEGGSTYLWNGPQGFNSNEAAPRIDNITLGHAGNYYVYVYNEGGCFGLAQVTIFVKPSVKAIATASPNPVPEFNSVQFTANTGIAYKWSGPLGFTSNAQNPFIKSVTRYMAGIYTVTVTNENGCPGIAKVNLRVLYSNKNNNLVVTEEIEDIHPDKVRIVENSAVYPNPTNDLLYFDSKGIAPICYMINDMSGKMETIQKTTAERYISTANLPSGVYRIRWKHEGADFWNENTFVKIR